MTTFVTLTTIKDSFVRKAITAAMLEWCGATYFNCRFNKQFSIENVGLNAHGFITLKAVSPCGKEDYVNENDISYHASMGQYLNLQKL